MNQLVMDVSHSQLAVFDGTLDKPFNDWTDRHVLQGFSWRPRSVSFRTLIEWGRMEVEVVVGVFGPSDQAGRVISVPFECGVESRVEIATITSSRIVELEPGTYQLVYETGQRGERSWSRVTFVRNGSLSPAILLQDVELDPVYPFLMEATPA